MNQLRILILPLLQKNLIYNILKTENLTIINSTHNPEDILGVDSHIQIIIDNENMTGLLAIQEIN